MTEWRFGSSVAKARASALLAPTTIGSIANGIASEMEVVCCHFQTCDDHTDFGRVVYCLRVPEDLFDRFFNSPHGYRGAYFRSPGEGTDANSTFIKTLTPQLLETSTPGASDSDLTWVRESLLSGSAKVWLPEHGLGLCSKCDGEWGRPSDPEAEILNGRWELGESGAQCFGRKAPRLTKIRIFGAFLDDRLNEFIPCRKRHRAEDIHMWGWS